MENDKIIKRKVYAVVPPKVEYSLTDLGISLKPILDSLKNFGEFYKKIS
jgi:DNA-binding HxlR family transcriptional regulator